MISCVGLLARDATTRNRVKKPAIDYVIVTSVTQVVPSLEDVFLDVVDRMDVAGAA